MSLGSFSANQRPHLHGPVKVLQPTNSIARPVNSLRRSAFENCPMFSLRPFKIADDLRPSFGDRQFCDAAAADSTLSPSSFSASSRQSCRFGNPACSTPMMLACAHRIATLLGNRDRAFASSSLARARSILRHVQLGPQDERLGGVGRGLLGVVDRTLDLAPITLGRRSLQICAISCCANSTTDPGHRLHERAIFLDRFIDFP